MTRPLSLALGAVAAATLSLSCSSGRTGQTDDPSDLRFVEVQDLPVVECAAVEYEAKQAPAALLVLLDRSSSMAQGNKWAFAAQAVVQAIDKDIFDSMHLGLYAAPSGNVQGPMCIFGFPVACQAPPFPQIDLKPAGTQKSGDASGVRHDIKSWLSTNNPDNGAGDASPLYAGLQNSIAALKSLALDGKRLLFVVTDGTLSCNQFSTRPGYKDCNGCDHDWEDPGNIISLLSAANSDAQKPIETFVVGVPGADTYDMRGCNYPPYRMRQALSAIAYAGSPGNVPADCTGKTYSQTGADPTKSCHFDLTQGNFNAQAVADAISLIRGKVLGCAFDLPKPEGGGAVDKTRVNVRYTDGGGTKQLYRRKDMTNDCKNDGCWDYTPEGKVELLGKACTDVQAATNIKVQLGVGCLTVFG